MKPVLFVAASSIAILFVCGVCVSSDAQPPTQNSRFGKRTVKPLMHQKLDKAKNILEGLTLEQHDKIASNARSLRLLSMEAGWNVVQTEEYAKQSEDFRRACDLLENAARLKDVNRAALSYVALTVRCVECHHYMRQQNIQSTKKKAKEPSKPPLARAIDRKGENENPKDVDAKRGD